MNDNTNYLLKNIPTDLWKKFKKKAVDEDADNYSQILIELIKNYTKTNTLVWDVSTNSYIEN
tara:strand:- start:1222 stop:1407 length:186 start_codon:yes stop_codon:yes gene_type:complete